MMKITALGSWMGGGATSWNEEDWGKGGGGDGSVCVTLILNKWINHSLTDFRLRTFQILKNFLNSPLKLWHFPNWKPDDFSLTCGITSLEVFHCGISLLFCSPHLFLCSINPWTPWPVLPHWLPSPQGAPSDPTLLFTCFIHLSFKTQPSLRLKPSWATEASDGLNLWIPPALVDSFGLYHTSWIVG